MKTAGFTMLELMVVVILIAVLTALALPKLTTAAQKSNIRSTRLELSTMVTRARAAAIQRGCVDSLHINSTQAWVTACKVSGTGRDTVGPVDRIGNRFSVTLSSSRTDYGFDPRGLLVGFSGGTIVITGTGGVAGFSDSVVINNVGKVTH
jgi:prepilin-type N-terminal cleavage/methylation domain-containing protein